WHGQGRRRPRPHNAPAIWERLNNCSSYAWAVGHRVRGKAHVGRIDGAIAEQVAVMMQALATPSRVLILARLRESPHSVGELAAAVGMELSAVSHQLR